MTFLNFRRAIFSLTCSLLVVALQSAAQAELIAYEPFDAYADGTPLMDANPAVLGFDGPWSGQNSNYTVSGGVANGATSHALAWVRADRFLSNSAIAATQTGDIYFSVLINKSPTLAAGSNGTVRLNFYNESTNNRLLEIGMTGSSFQAGILNGQPDGAEVNTAGYTVGTTAFLIGKLTRNATGTQERLEVWANPGDFSTQAAAGAATSVVAASNFLNDGEGLARMVLESHAGGADATPYWFDEIRVGTTWDDVAVFEPVPEPTSAALFAAAMVGLTAVRRRRCVKV